MSVIRDVLIWDSERKDAERGDIVIDSSGFVSEIANAGEGEGELIFDGKGKHAAIPGLVNAHTHVSMTLLRGLGEELPLMEWLTTKIFPVEERLGAQHIRAGAELAMLEMLSGGVTCFADMYYFMGDVAEATLASGMRAALCRGITGDDMGKIEENLSLAEMYGGRDDRITVQMGPHAPYTVPMHAMERIAATAREKNLGIHLHWLETEGELARFRDEYRLSPSDYLKKTGLLEASELILAHCVWFPTEELTCVQRDNVTVVHNPKSNLKLGSGYAPIKEMMASGINIALGTDGAASNNRLDVWDEMRTASLMHKGYHRDPTLLSAREAIAMATVNGARGLGFKKVGLIKPGFYADVTVVKMDGPQYVGCDATNLPEFLVYAGSSRDVAATIVAGKVLYDGGTFTTLDRDRILSETSRYRYEITRG